MVKKLLILGLVLLCLGPSVAIVSVGALLGPVLCITGSLTVGPIPDSLTATTADGTPVTLDKQQLTHAATVITTGAGIPGMACCAGAVPGCGAYVCCMGIGAACCVCVSYVGAGAPSMAA